MTTKLDKSAFFKRGKYILWALLGGPALFILARYSSDAITYGQVIHQTGAWSVGLLCVALAATPLRRWAPRSSWTQWLVYHRRAFGVASFGYATVHTLVYLQRKWGYGYIQQEALQPDLATGWVAMLLFLLLAVTSNDGSVRLLRRNWQRLHRLVYLATALTFAHWALTALDRTAAGITFAALVAVEALRFKRSSRP